VEWCDNAVQEADVQGNREVVAYFYQSLLKTAEARAYVRERNLSLELCEEMGVGYCPFTCAVQNIHKNMRGRLTFTINDAYGRPVGISGRDLTGESLFKYYNTHLTKSNHWYNLYRAISSILEKDFVYVVEGYMDVLTMVKHGIHNVVAMMGTGVGWTRACLLKRYTSNVVALPHNDDAGEKSYGRLLCLLQHPRLGFFVERVPVPSAYNDADECLNNYQHAGRWAVYLRDLRVTNG
jgi:DNA primase